MWKIIMKSTVTLKTKDLCEALSIGRHQLRIWTDTLAPYSAQTTKARSARCYDPADLLFFAVIKHIDDIFGLAVQSMARFSNDLYVCIREPQSLTIQPYIFINIVNNQCERLDLNMSSREGIIVDIQPAQLRVCQFLGLSPQQSQLQLGLVKVK